MFTPLFNHSIVANSDELAKIIKYDSNGSVINKDILKTCILEQGKKMSLKLDLDNPKTIQDKINWIKLNDVSYTKSIAADKIKLHSYCTEKIGKDICIPILKVYNSVEDIDFNELPDKFVLKCNHGYAMNIIVDKSQNKFTTLKEPCASFDDCKRLLNKWLKSDFGMRSLQLHYSLIERKCFAEKFVNDGHQTLADYKFWCCNGEPLMIQVISDRYTDNLHANVYDTNWNWYDLGWHDFRQDENNKDPKPVHLEEMLNYARTFAKDFKFVRVDFYVINDEPYLGELTFTPDNGYGKFKNAEEDLYWGSRLNLK